MRTNKTTMSKPTTVEYFLRGLLFAAVVALAGLFALLFVATGHGP